MRPNLTRTRAVIVLAMALLLSANLFAAGGASRSPYHHDPKPWRLYYFGYSVDKAGFGIGPEINLSWVKMEKSGCRGARISDRQFVMIPNIGGFQNEQNTFSLYGNLEFNYNVTYHRGFTVEVFAAAGYAQVLTNTESPVDQPLIGKEVDAATSGFMPEAGIGFGYDFQKLNGKDLPLAMNFRMLATSTDIANMAIVPAFQAGLIYDF
ncbi:MAG: hypothetical protein R2794_06250 [Chitinophagales bacterium]